MLCRPKSHKSYWYPACWIVIACLLSACEEGLALFDTRNLVPYQTRAMHQFVGEVMPIDLDGDGVDELLNWDGPDQPLGGAALLLIEADNRAIEQINVPGQIQGSPRFTRRLDGTMQVFIPYIRDDSLFLHSVDHRGNELFDMFMYARHSGNPGLTDRGWDPKISYVRWVDQDDDGTDELLTVIATGYAGHPRGFLLYDVGNQQMVDSLFIGVKPSTRGAFDIDLDGDEELLIASHASGK